MGKTQITVLICDKCGARDIDPGISVYRSTLSIAGHSEATKVAYLCHACVREVTSQFPGEVHWTRRGTREPEANEFELFGDDNLNPPQEQKRRRRRTLDEVIDLDA